MVTEPLRLWNCMSCGLPSAANESEHAGLRALLETVKWWFTCPFERTSHFGRQSTYDWGGYKYKITYHRLGDYSITKYCQFSCPFPPNVNSSSHQGPVRCTGGLYAFKPSHQQSRSYDGQFLCRMQAHQRRCFRPCCNNTSKFTLEPGLINTDGLVVSKSYIKCLKVTNFDCGNM